MLLFTAVVITGGKAVSLGRGRPTRRLNARSRHGWFALEKPVIHGCMLVCFTLASALLSMPAVVAVV